MPSSFAIAILNTPVDAVPGMDGLLNEPYTVNLAGAVVVPIPKLPVMLALPATSSLFGGNETPIPTLPPSCCSSILPPAAKLTSVGCRETFLSESVVPPVNPNRRPKGFEATGSFDKKNPIL